MSPGLACWSMCSTDAPTAQSYTLSLHDALPICLRAQTDPHSPGEFRVNGGASKFTRRSEEHTSELQSPDHIVCRILLDKKNHAEHCEIACVQVGGQGSGNTSLFASRHGMSEQEA